MNAARKTQRFPAGGVSNDALLRMLRFPAVRSRISGALAKAVPEKVDAVNGRAYVRFRMADPKRFHPALMATIPVGSRGTLLVIGTPRSAVKKPRELEAFLRRMGKGLKTEGRRSLIYQLRTAGIIGGAETQAVLVPRERVLSASRMYAGRAAANPILATIGFNPGAAGNVFVCYRCGKVIKGEHILQVPPKFMEAMGEFTKRFHKKCYKESEAAAARDLGIKPNPLNRRETADVMKSARHDLAFATKPVKGKADRDARIFYAGRAVGKAWAAKLHGRAREGAEAAFRRGYQYGMHLNPAKGVPGISKWHMYAGGTSAAQGKHSYDYYFPQGRYMVSAFTTKSGQHAGYVVYFLNEKGATEGGLWQQLGVARSPEKGATLCRAHFARTFGAAAKNPSRDFPVSKTEIRALAFVKRLRAPNQKRYATAYASHRWGLGSMPSAAEFGVGPARAAHIRMGLNRIIKSRRNPLTKKESVDLLQFAKAVERSAKMAHREGRRVDAAWKAGEARGVARAVQRYGIRRAGRAADRIGRRASDTAMSSGIYGARQNPGTVEIKVPFRDGQKITPARMRAWVESLPDNAITRLIKSRFEKCMTQYKRFHLGAEPTSFTYRAIPMGSQGSRITDVDMVVSEGKEWAAPYQVPKSSGKYDPKVQGRYIHAHGESKMDIDIKKAANTKLLPERFHTADGKFVGVVPSRNVKITDWYRG